VKWLAADEEKREGRKSFVLCSPIFLTFGYFPGRWIFFFFFF